MVDALKRAHRLLEPSGWIIDVHPTASDAAVEVGVFALFVVTAPRFSVRALDLAVIAVIAVYAVILIVPGFLVNPIALMAAGADPLAQFELHRDPEKSMVLARQTISAKLANAAAVLSAFGDREEARSAASEEAVVQIMGVGPSATIRVDETGRPKDN